MIVIGRRYGHSSVAAQIIMNILLNEMIIIGSGFLPLLHGQTFPGDIIEDKEGIESINNNITRLIKYCELIQDYQLLNQKV